MTRKEALREAIRLVSETDWDEERKQAVKEGLELCIRELPFAAWSRAAVFDACEQYIAEHGHPLHLHDFRSRELPSHTTIQNRFGISLREFRDTYYPLPYRKKPDPAAVTDEFRREYLRCGASGRREYDRKRRSGAPCAATVIRRAGLSGWRELLLRAGLPVSGRDPVRPEAGLRLTVHYAWEDIPAGRGEEPG